MTKITPEYLAELKTMHENCRARDRLMPPIQQEGMRQNIYPLMDSVPALIARIEELEARLPRWIPVAERLPTGDDATSGGGVLVRDSGGEAWDCHWEFDPCADHRDDVNFGQGELLITHWMPLPPDPEDAK